ncbi:hypothetical protein, partial [Sutterella wadsworthensis]|uniref:hypothetical protein n=1 Tax=Sutterella wadsworthensis TaxID=40545 RepID=UPI003076C585
MSKANTIGRNGYLNKKRRQAPSLKREVPAFLLFSGSFLPEGAVQPENRGIYTQSDSSKKSSR